MTKEEAYEKATMQELGGNPNGTRQDIVWRAMDIYAEQFREGQQLQSQQQLNLFQKKEVTLHSGEKSKFFIECDALQDADIECFASLIAERVTFGSVVGIPTGGVKLQEELKKYITPGNKTLLICDDVLTSSGSMEEMKEKIGKRNVKGAVIFSRGKCPDWVTPIFQMSDESQSATSWDQTRKWEEKLYNQLKYIYDSYSDEWAIYDDRATAKLLYDYKTRNIP